MNESDNNELILAFDSLYTRNDIQLLKLTIPYLNPEARPLLASFIKLQELSYCYMQIHAIKLSNLSLQIHNMEEFIQEALPYCNEKQKNMLSQIKNMKKYIAIFNQLKPILQQLENTQTDFLSQILKQNEKEKGAQDLFTSFLQSNLSAEQKDLFESYKKRFESFDTN